VTDLGERVWGFIRCVGLAALVVVVALPILLAVFA
jgi:hypothetical protein